MKLRHMPSTPMTKQEMEEQCKLVSEVAKFEILEEDEEFIRRERLNNKGWPHNTLYFIRSIK